VKIRSLILSLGFALSTLLFASLPAFAAHTATGMAHVRVVHAAPAAPNVDVYVDGAKFLPNFAFGTVTDYVQVAAGAHSIAVVPQGQDISKAVITQSVTVEASKAYTVAAIGNSTPAVTPALIAFADDNTLASNQAKVRVYHLSDNAGKVAVATGGSTVIASLAFQSASDYLTVPAGTYNFTVTLLDKSNTAVPLNNAALDANKVTSVFALGEVGGSGATVFAFKVGVATGVPGLPQTGYAQPQSSTNMLAIALGGIVGLLLLGGSVFAVNRRRAH